MQLVADYSAQTHRQQRAAVLPMTRRGALAAAARRVLRACRPASAASAVFNGDPVDPSRRGRSRSCPASRWCGRAPTVCSAPPTTSSRHRSSATSTWSCAAAICRRPRHPAAGARRRAAARCRSASPDRATPAAREIPFTVFLSNGVTGGGEPAGHLLAAPDMDGMPVIVAAFADLDGDGVIGPTTHERRGSAALQFELRELVPVGRTAALFSGGVARGSIAVQRGLPPSQGGLTVALVAMALTGPFDPAFFDGAIPSGPAIATALPFLPQRDLARLIRDRAVPAGPGHDPAAAHPVRRRAAAGCLRAAARRQRADHRRRDRAARSRRCAWPCATARAPARRRSAARPHLMLGSERFASLALLRLVPVDRFDNPADPPHGWSRTLLATARCACCRRAWRAAARAPCCAPARCGSPGACRIGARRQRRRRARRARRYRHRHAAVHRRPSGERAASPT